MIERWVLPDGVAGDNDDHNVDADSGNQNLPLPNQFLAKYSNDNHITNKTKYSFILGSVCPTND